MIILKQDFKHGEVSLKLSSSDDIWYISHLITPNDLITMKSERKIKMSDGSDKITSVIKKTIVLTLCVEEVSYDSTNHQLRVKGKVVSESDFVPKGAYHTFGLEIDSSFTLVKKQWPSYLQEKLIEATKSTAENILIVIFDREEALFSVVKQSGIEHLVKLESEVQKKDIQSNIGDSIYDQIIKKLLEYEKIYAPSSIVCASPSFWKIYLEQKIPADLKSKSIFVTCSEVHKKVVTDLLARPELKNILSAQRTSKEIKFVNLVLEKLQKNLVAYGFEDVKTAALAGAISEIGVTDKLITKLREENKYDELDSILSQIDSSKGKIHFISSDETTKQIDGLGGIVGILRWN